MNRESYNPEKPPGSIDRLNTTELFGSADVLGIPMIDREQGGQSGRKMPDYLIPHRTKVRPGIPLEEEPLAAAVHFFLDDFRFEPVWSSPRKGLSYIRGVGFALSPDFSLYADWPLALQIFNVYRNRWCGAYWRSRGIRVIPTVSWSGEESYSFCFLGVEKGSAVAISTVGVAAAETGSEGRRMFVSGCRQMLEVLEPSAVLLYGEASQELVQESGLDTVQLRKYPSRWKSIRAARKEASTG